MPEPPQNQVYIRVINASEESEFYLTKNSRPAEPVKWVYVCDKSRPQSQYKQKQKQTRARLPTPRQTKQAPSEGLRIISVVSESCTFVKCKYLPIQVLLIPLYACV